MVSTHLKNISQIGNLPQIGVKIKNLWNHHLESEIKSCQETSSTKLLDSDAKHPRSQSRQNVPLEIPERRSLKTSVVMKSPTKPGDLDIFLRRKKGISPSWKRMAKTIWRKTEDMNKKRLDPLYCLVHRGFYKRGNKFTKNEVTPNKEYMKPCLALRD